MQPIYDVLGNVLPTTTTLPQGTDTQVFCYDDLSRLVWAGSSGTPGCAGAPTPSDTGALAGTSASYSASDSYDTLNRLTSAPLGGYSYSDPAHADAATSIGSGGSSAWSASYDAAGNMTCRAPSAATTCAGASPTGNLLSYDNEGRLTGWQNTPSSPTETAAYLYDGEGNRVQQVATVNGVTTTTDYLGSLEEVSTTGSSTTTTAYYGGLAESVNGSLSYTLSDGLGSVSEAVDTNGSVVATQLYGPSGTVRYQSGALPTDKGYTGQIADALTGLDFYHARSYDPLAEQFTSADTTLAGGLNEYAYVGDNPETNTDPSGHVYAVANNHPSYQDFGATVAGLIGADSGTANDGLSTALYIALNDPVAYQAAEAYDASQGKSTLGNVQRDAFLYVQATPNSYWNSSAAHMTEYLQLQTWKNEFVMLISGGGGHGDDLNLFNSEDATVAASAGLDGAPSGGEAVLPPTDPTAPGCGLSFAATTPVATPQGERPIASLHAGQQVEAYDPATGKTTTETVARVFLNHDADRLDVTLATAAPAAGTDASAATASSGHGRQAAHAASATTDDVIHTTASHPWLTADHGWLVAGQLRVGEPVRLLDGGTAQVVALRSVPGVGAMWDLSLASVHTFAVGVTQAVVHNCPVGGDGGNAGPPGPDALNDAGYNGQSAGRSGSERPIQGPPDSFWRSQDGGHIQVYDSNGRISWDISAQRAKPITWNQNPSTGAWFPREGPHLPTPYEWLLLFPTP